MRKAWQDLSFRCRIPAICSDIKPGFPNADFINHTAGGFTFLEVLLFLVIVSSITVLAWPRFGRVVEIQNQLRYEYAVSRMATQAWRHAQIQGRDMHMMFQESSSTVVWTEGCIHLHFPDGFTIDSSSVWLFPPDGYPNNSKIYHVRGTDSLVVTCVLNSANG